MLGKTLHHKLLIKLVLPIALVGVCASVFFFNWLPGKIDQFAVNTGTETGMAVARQYMALRKYYTENVVDKVLQKSHFKASADHRNMSDAIPLPATLFKELGQYLETDKDISVRLYSPYPLTDSPPLSSTERNIWRQLNTYPNKVIAGMHRKENGDRVIRVALADTMSHVACIDCHNAHPQSPKRDWMLGEVSGVIQVNIPAESMLKQGQALAGTIKQVVLASFLFLMGATIYNYWGTNKRIEQLVYVASQIARGHSHVRANLPGSDELSQLGSTLDHMLDSIDHMQRQLNNSNQEYQLLSKDLETLNNELEIRVKQRTQKLEDALENLELAKDELLQAEGAVAISSLVAGIAHDVNNPLGVAITATSFLVDENQIFANEIEQGRLRKSVLNNYLETSKESAHIIQTNLDKAKNLIRSFKELTVNQCSADVLEIDVTHFIQSLLLSLSPVIRKTRIDIQTEIEANLLITSSPGFLSQIFTNLILNSVKHGFGDQEEGIIRINIYSESEKRIALDYADNGCGIDKNLDKQVFEPFYTTKRAQGGSGLGLNIIKELVLRRLSGELTLYHPAPKGLGFKISLPKRLVTD